MPVLVAGKWYFCRFDLLCASLGFAAQRIYTELPLSTASDAAIMQQLKLQAAIIKETCNPTIIQPDIQPDSG